MSRDFDLGGIQGASSGLDAFFASETSVVTPLRTQTRPLAPEPQVAKKASGMTRVASLSQLEGFVRVAEDQLVHKSDKDLWSLQKGADGEFYIQRMFDDAGGPLKG